MLGFMQPPESSDPYDPSVAARLKQQVAEVSDTSLTRKSRLLALKEIHAAVGFGQFPKEAREAKVRL